MCCVWRTCCVSIAHLLQGLILQGLARHLLVQIIHICAVMLPPVELQRRLRCQALVPLTTCRWAVCMVACLRAQSMSFRVQQGAHLGDLRLQCVLPVNANAEVSSRSGKTLPIATGHGKELGQRTMP